MSKPNHVCRVCGKEYYACDTCDEKTVFHWRSVACSTECFIKYVELVEESRKENNQKNKPKKKNDTMQETNIKE